jgi:hypothetical protein
MTHGISKLFLIVAVFLFVGCQSAQLPPPFASYRPAGESKNLGIEIFYGKGSGFRTWLVEVRINNEPVASFLSSPSTRLASLHNNINPKVVGEYNGKKVEMTGQYYHRIEGSQITNIGSGWIVDVIIDGDRAARLTVRD